MVKLIALKTLVPDVYRENFVQENFFSRIKQESLLFDQIGILRLDLIIKTIKEKTQKLGDVFSEMEYEWLKDSKIIFDPFIESPLTPLSKEKMDNKNYRLLISTLIKTMQRLTEIKFDSEESNNMTDIENSLVSEQHSVLLRLFSIDMEKTVGDSIVTILPDSNYMNQISGSEKSIVAKIVINKLPLPNNNTPWEQIADYRNSSKNQTNLLNLRRWIRKISSETLSPNEIEEEIEWLINEFENHMKIHKIKANTETLEVIVKTPLEIIENLVKLKLSKLPEPFFAIKKRQINLMEAELNAPGREMAYIIKTRDTFESDE